VITHAVTVEIDRPITAVFEWLTNASNHRRWDRSSVEMEPLEPGAWREGLAFREVRKIGPRKMEIRSHVAAIDPPTSMDLQSDTGPSFNGHWRLEERAGGTTLRWSCEMQPDGPGFLEPLIARGFKKAVDSNFERLKSVIESDLPASAAGG